MPEPIRVRDDVTGHEYSTYGVTEDGQPYEGLTKLNEPAVDERTGELLPPKYPAVDAPAPAKAAKAAESTSGRKATTEEH